MKITDRFIMALRNLWRRKSRTILTILSVVIGSTSIILMLAFAEGITASQKQMIESFQGLTTIQIYNDSPDGLKVDAKLINDLKKVNHVSSVIPSKNVYLEMKVDDSDQYQLDGSFQVIPNDVFKLLKKEDLEWGNIPKTSDDSSILLGTNASAMTKTKHGADTWFEPDENFDFNAHKYIFSLGYKDDSQDDGVNFGNEDNPDDPNKGKPQVVEIPAKISGKLAQGSILTGYNSYMNEATYNKLKKEDEKLAYPTMNQSYDKEGNPIKETAGKIAYDSVSVVIDSTKNVKDAEIEIKKLGYSTNSMAKASEEVENQTRTIMLILGGIGSIAFIVSAIGIINTMIMSIYERQKEIGVMKVIGASVSDVQTMFLIESGFIGFFGGILGLIISLVAAYFLNKVLSGSESMFSAGGGPAVIIPFWLGLVGVLFSALVGVLAGYLPARRATKLSAIDALRAE